MEAAAPSSKEEFLGLMDAALRGEEVIISAAGRQSIKLVPLVRRFKHGILKDQLKGPVPDFLEPMSEEELRLWEGSD